jgi:alpha-galactosidase
MGWNSYNFYKVAVTDAQIRATADAFVSSGLKAAGFQYVVIDDLWCQGRDASGNMVPNTTKFPNGMKALADYVHGKGLKFGLYANPTKISCAREPGSYQHEVQDANQFAAWGVDYLKYDWCGKQSGENGKFTNAQVIARYVTMRDALKATKRPIVFALCDKGQGVVNVNIPSWSDTVGHMWRIGGDINASWSQILLEVDFDSSLAKYAAPGGWNDPDMMEVGNGSLTDAENKAHFSMWAILAAPMILGNDVTKMSAGVQAVLTNAEVIAIDQDSLGAQGVRTVRNNGLEVWVKNLKNGDKAVVLLNRNAAAGSLSLKWTDNGIGWKSTDLVRIRDLWQHTTSASVSQGTTASLPGQSAVMLRLTNLRTTGMIVDGSAGSGPLAIARFPGGLRLFVPPGAGAGMARAFDPQGHLVAGFPVVEGWNRIPSAVRSGALYLLETTLRSGSTTQRLILE